MYVLIFSTLATRVPNPCRRRHNFWALASLKPSPTRVPILQPIISSISADVLHSSFIEAQQPVPNGTIDRLKVHRQFKSSRSRPPKSANHLKGTLCTSKSYFSRMVEPNTCFGCTAVLPFSFWTADHFTRWENATVGGNMWLPHNVLAPKLPRLRRAIIFWNPKEPSIGIRGEAIVGRTVDDPE